MIGCLSKYPGSIRISDQGRSAVEKAGNFALSLLPIGHGFYFPQIQSIDPLNRFEKVVRVAHRYSANVV